MQNPFIKKNHSREEKKHQLARLYAVWGSIMLGTVCVCGEENYGFIGNYVNFAYVYKIIIIVIYWNEPSWALSFCSTKGGGSSDWHNALSNVLFI
jgi:hypothetical protein